MANHEKRVEQEAAYPIPISLYNCYRTEKRYQECIAMPLFSILMPHCPVTVVQRYRDGAASWDGVCSLLFHSFFAIPISVNPRRACAARVTVVVLCVCVRVRVRARARARVCQCVSVCQCVQASHPLLTQLQDQVDIPMDSVSCSLQNTFGVFRIMASFRR